MQLALRRDLVHRVCATVCENGANAVILTDRTSKLSSPPSRSRGQPATRTLSRNQPGRAPFKAERSVDPWPHFLERPRTTVIPLTR